MQKRKVTELQRLTPEAFRSATKLPLVVVLDNVRSLYNVGSVFRTADAFRLEAIYLCGITGCPPHTEIHKTALGAEDTMTWKYYYNTLSAVGELKQAGYTLCAVEQAQGSIDLGSLQLMDTKKYALLLGNEVKGVQQEVVDACDMCLEIPQYGTKHSMNVSVAAGIVIWTFLKQLKELQI